MNDCTNVHEVAVITPENIKRLIQGQIALEDRFVRIGTELPLSEVVLRVIRHNPNSGLGCNADVLWNEVISAAPNNNILFAEVLNVVNLLLHQRRIRIRFDVNTNLNSVSFLAEKEDKRNAS